MNIRIAWRFTRANGTTNIGVGRWMKDTPANRRLLRRTLETAVVLDPNLQLEKWLEEDLDGLHDQLAEQFPPVSGMRSRRFSKRLNDESEIVRIDYQ